MSEPIRSQLPNENYRHGWDETFGRKDKESLSPVRDKEERDAMKESMRRAGLFPPAV